MSKKLKSTTDLRLVLYARGIRAIMLLKTDTLCSAGLNYTIYTHRIVQI